jgi:DNA-binding LacI/PurR family transcriptional regulator
MSEKRTTVSLKTVAERVGLAPCSVSSVLNHAPASSAIPQKTKERIFRAAAELNYRPNLLARSLRSGRTRLITVITSDLGRPPVARVLAGVQKILHRRGYLLVIDSFDCASEWITISVQLQQRGIEGIIAVDAILPNELDLPVASVDLDYRTLVEPLDDQLQSWLSELGECAAETIVRQIESQRIPRRMKVAPKAENAFFNLPNARLAVEAQ